MVEAKPLLVPNSLAVSGGLHPSIAISVFLDSDACLEQIED